MPTKRKLTPKQKANRKKWLEALRSGKYEQGTGVLCNTNNEFCCWGVLCDVLQVPSKIDEFGSREYTFGGYTKERHLPTDSFTKKMVGISIGDEVEIDGDTLTLEKHNDGVYLDGKLRVQKSFEQIADAIETQL